MPRKGFDLTPGKEQGEVENAVAKYDRSMVGPLQRAYYGESGFCNFGYWTDETTSQQQASENLVDRLLEMIPEKTGSILDVACGMGASTKMLLNYYDAGDVYALNYSPKQLGLARGRAKGCGFVAMDAASLGFDDESFDNVLCVEAAFHFNTRRDFLREALRVLKPGGRLVHSDILSDNRKRRPANYLRDPEELATVLREAGFVDVEVKDVTKECWLPFRENVRRWPGREREAGNIGIPRYLWYSAVSAIYRRSLGRRITHYTLSSATRPLR